MKGGQRVKCQHCDCEFNEKELKTHESVCLLNEMNLKKFAIFIAKFIIRQRVFQPIRLVPTKTKLKKFSIYNQIEDLNDFHQRIFSDLSLEESIDFLLSIAISRNLVSIDELPPPVRFVYDARQYCTERQFDDKMNELESFEKFLCERITYSELQNQRVQSVQYRTPISDGEIRRKFWNRV